MKNLYWWFKDVYTAYLNPHQHCVHCTLPYWTFRPWKVWTCRHPNCRAAHAKHPVAHTDPWSET